MAYQKSPEPPPEMMTFDEQVVACEIEVDTFDREIESFKEGEEDGEIQNSNDGVPGTSGYHHHHQYFEEDVEVEDVGIVDPNSVFLFDEDTSQIHQITNDHYEYLEEEDIEDVTSSEGPSTSSSIPGPSTSSSIPSTSSVEPQGSPQRPPTHFQAHQRGLIRYQIPAQEQQNSPTYFIRKNRGIGGGGSRQIGGVPYGPVHFQTQYSVEPLARCANKRALKRTHTIMSADEMETMMEDAQVMKRIQTEINALKKTNDEMKKAYETSHRRFESINMVWMEAKQKQREALEEKRELTRALTQARTTHTQLVKQVNQSGPQYQFH